MQALRELRELIPTYSTSSGQDDATQTCQLPEINTSHNVEIGTCDGELRSSDPTTSLLWDEGYAQLWPLCACVLLLISCHLAFSMFGGSQKSNNYKYGRNSLMKIAIAVALALSSLVQAFYNRNSSLVMNIHHGASLANVLQAGVFGLLASLAMEEQRIPSTRLSLSISTFWGLVMTSSAAALYSSFALAPEDVIWSILFKVDFLLCLAQFSGAFIALSLTLFSDRSAERTSTSAQGRVTSEDDVHPEEGASWWANLTLSWTTPLLWTGFKQNLVETDIPKIASTDTCRKVIPKLERAWRQEEFRTQLINETQKQQVDDHGEKSSEDSILEKSSRPDTEKLKETGSLFTALRQAYGYRYCFLQVLKTVLEMHDIVMTLLTAALMNHIQNRQNESMWYGIAILVSMFVFKCSTEIGHHRMWFTITRLSRHMKISTMMIIFKKSMTVKNECLKDKTNGEIVNLISDDCDRVFNASNIVFIFMMAPIKIGIAMYLLYSYLGSSMLVGVVLMALLLPLNTMIGKRMNSLHKVTNDCKDNRVKLMNEIINGIKVLKLYAWEKSFIDKVGAIRDGELDSRMKKSVMHACIDSAFRAIPFLVKSCAFGTFLWLGGHLDATKAFTTISLFHSLNDPLSLTALLMPMYTEAVDSIKRINKFLNGEDISSDVVKKSSKEPSAISVKDGEFTWESTSLKPTLTNINVNIPKGGLVAVVGMVGSGKSSLLSSILGEMEKLDGDVNLQGRVAYVPQEAWILNASLQDNVIFGSKMNRQQYREVVHSCCLKNDINILTAGDKTEIGEKGINLSGGQKQRVSLARAVYKEADVYLLDDPLSAVDAHVGKNIFQRVIGPRGILKDKTRVLVTHGIQWLPFVDSIIVMKDGQVSETGTYQELISRDGAFAQFLTDLCAHTSTEDDTEVTKLKQNIFKRLNSRQEEKDFDDSALTEDISRDLEKLALKEDSGESSSDNDDDFSDNTDSSSSDGKLIDEEDLEEGAVKGTIYLDYLKAVGVKSCILFAFIYFITIVSDNYNTFSVKLWTDDPMLVNTSLADTEEYFDRSLNHFYTFFISGFIEVVSSFLFIMLTLQGGFLAGNRIHNSLLDTIMKCPMSFFDTTPSARVVNRFSNDAVRVDTLGHYLRGCIERFFSLSASIILIIFNAPVILACLLPVTGLYYILYRIHVSSLRQIRRFRSKHRSPMFVHFSETLNGIASIRAYSCQNRFIQTMENKIEEWVKLDTVEHAVGLWFGMRVTFLYLFIQMIAGLITVVDTSMTAGMAGLVLIFAGQFCGNLSSLIHLSSNLETDLISLERVLEYSKKPTEAPWEIPEMKPAADWPSKGHVVLNDVKARYRDGLDLVLKGVDCDIKHGEKIGIVGRTGAGKSSLTVALFRLIETASGHIDVDNQKTADLGLHDLRCKITILPQDPVIFGGTLRMNLDPFDKCSTEELWVALQHAHLKPFVENLPDQLDFKCGEGGKNLSVGQRQLLCLARTLLRQTNILVLDEATAAVDMETDELIQKTIRTEFKDCTVLTIAHRLNTIMDYDRILVLDQGVVKEFDSPNKLLANTDSTFYSMAKDAKLVE